ncbi:hypothetical protein [Streptomyces sp. LMG1-1-1.1]|uniref:hypothetical protein n=1 Tax=Streptomyces sp. LMG1-1-1.1 TaxID=3135245 RepID=UPI0034650131
MSARTRGRFLAPFGIFAECLLAGVWIAAAGLPLVTLPAALAAGASHLRRSADGRQAGLRYFATDLRGALRGGGRAAGLAYAAALALVAADLTLVRALPVPGGRTIGTLAVLAALWLTVTVLRAAAAWRPGLRWRALLGPAARRALRDPAGSLLVVCGLAVIAASAWFSAPLALPALGILVASAVAADHRLAGPHSAETTPPLPVIAPRSAEAAPTPPTPVVGNRSAGAEWVGTTDGAPCRA